MKRKIYLIIGCIFLAVFVVSASMLFITLNRYNKANAVYNDLQNRLVEPAKEDTQKETAPISVDFGALLKENADVKGWLYCEGTPINYPVVQAKDNDYYLHKDLAGNYIINGTLFVDCRCPIPEAGQNYIIYGHNMNNGTMFGTLTKYKDQGYYDEHPILYYLTPEKNYKIELFAGMVTAAGSEVYTPQFKTLEDFSEYINGRIAASTFSSNVEVTKEDKVITLSTCSYEFNNARYAIFGKLTTLSD